MYITHTHTHIYTLIHVYIFFKLKTKYFTEKKKKKDIKTLTGFRYCFPSSHDVSELSRNLLKLYTKL